MNIIKTIAEMRDIIKKWKKDDCTVGLVPTMGYLHAGHGALIKNSVENNSKTVVSVFVNPTQFAPNEDLEKYPRDIERDSELIKELHGDIVFNPAPDEMYSKNNITGITMDNLFSKLCGMTRPTHFAGVCQVVSKLFNIITPDNAYFGLKDFQQYVIIKKLVEDLNFPININPVDIVRESDGLALSSRNIYLNSEERQSALLLSKSLNQAKSLIDSGETNSLILIEEMENIISKTNHTKIDYIKVVDVDTLDDISIIKDRYAILLAVYVGNTRLIDNYTKLF